MKRIISILIALILLCLSTAYASEGIVSYHADFTALTGITADAGAVLTADPTDNTNMALHFTAGNYKAITLSETMDLSTPLNVEGKFYRDYSGAAAPYWDLRVILQTTGGPVMLSAFGKNVYMGNAWDNISVYDYVDATWSGFRIRMTESAGVLTAELFLDGNSYGTVTENITGSVTGLTIGAYPGAGGGSIYLDDVAYINESAELQAILAAIESDTASQADCEQWINELVGSEYQTILAYCGQISDYAVDKGYLTVETILSAFPANGVDLYAGDCESMQYIFAVALSDDTPTVTLTNGSTPVSATVSTSGNVLTIEATITPGGNYTLSVAGLKAANGSNITFTNVNFTTKNIPVVNIVKGGSYPYGQALTWTELPGTATTAVLSDGTNTQNVTNGGAMTLSGNVTLTLTAGGATHSIPFYLVPNAVPVAENVRIEKDAIDTTLLRGKYNYNDADGDAQDVAGTVLEWYISDEADTGYTVHSTGDSFTIDSTLYNKYVKFAVTPKSNQEPTTGVVTYSDVLALPSAPVAQNVRISGSATAGGTLTGFYDYFDANGDPESGDTVMEWVTNTGTVISTGGALALSSSDAGMQIAFRVTVKNNVEPGIGTPVTSAFVTVSAGSGRGNGGGGSNIIVGSNSGSANRGSSSLPAVTPSAPARAEGEYTDTVNHWCKEAVRDLTLAGVVNGMTETTFCPDDQITRAQFVTMIMRAMEVEPVTYAGIFHDVSAEAWYADYVQAAVLNGVISVDTHFRPDAPITRQEAAKVVAAFVTKSDSQAENVTFTDGDTISDWAVEYVEAAAAAGLFIGDDNGNFNPHNALTRAEGATVLWRAMGLDGGADYE